MMSSVKHFVWFGFVCLCVIGFLAYAKLVWQGRQTYVARSQEIQALFKAHPDYFETIFSQIMPTAEECNESKLVCQASISQQLDTLHNSNQFQNSGLNYQGRFQSITIGFNQPYYFIQFKNDDQIEKLLLSGEYKIEQIDTREERKVKTLLKGNFSKLYGPYFNSEVFQISPSGKRRWYDPKPNYLKDLYSQMEIIVPHTNSRGDIIGAVVYLHGE